MIPFVPNFEEPLPLNWVGTKKRPTQFASNKNASGTDYPSKITEANQKHDTKTV